MTDNSEIKSLPDNWCFKKISAISEKVSVGFVGITTPYFTDSSNGVPLIRSQNIRNGEISLQNLAYVTKEFHSKNRKSQLKDGDVIIVRVGENRGDTCILRDEFEDVNCANVVFFRPQRIYGRFVELFLRSPIGQHALISLTTGSAQGVINTKSIAELLVPIPPELEALEISELFDSIEGKIGLLHRQNTSLEKMAETLFRKWFVEEAKEEWEEVKLGSIVEIINGVSYKSDDLNSSKTAMVTLKSFDRNGGFRMDGFKEYTGKYKEQHILKEGDLVVAHTDITQEADVIGNPIMVIGNPLYDILVFSMDLVKVNSKHEIYSNEFLYLLMKSREFKEHCLGYSNGSTVLHLNKKAIPEYEMKLPPNKLINEFSLSVKPLVQKQFKNQTQIRTLAALRDTLLPKLMSGEVTVEPCKLK